MLDELGLGFRAPAAGVDLVFVQPTTAAQVTVQPLEQVALVPQRNNSGLRHNVG